MLTLEDLKGKNICVTGEFQSISRARMNWVIYTYIGKHPVNHCNEKTDFILVADEAIEYCKETGKASTKLAAAIDLKRKGHHIRFISEKTYYDLFGYAGCLKQFGLKVDMNGAKMHDTGKVTFRYEH